MKFQLAVVVWFQLGCYTSLALHTITISEMPRKIEIFAKTAMDSHRVIVCDIRRNQHYMLQKQEPLSSAFVRYGNGLFPFLQAAISWQTNPRRKGYGRRITLKIQNNRWPITNPLGSLAFRRRMCGVEYCGFSIPNSFLCCGCYLTNTSPSSNSKELSV